MTSMVKSRTAVVVNRHAGTVRSMGEEAVRKLIVDALGVEAGVALLDGAAIEDHIRALLRDGVERVIVGGGDGTVASAAGLIAESPVALGILPLGTMNLMAQTIGMAASPAAALAQLREAEVKQVDAARANGRLFLHHVSFGLQPRMVRIRERMGYSSRLTKMLAAARATIAVLLNPRTERLGLSIDGEPLELRTPGLIISNNVYENAMMLKQARLDQGVLGIYALEPMTLAAYLRLAIDVLRGRWRDNVNVRERRGRTVHLTRHRRLRRGDSRGIKATIDGELTLFDLPLTIESQLAALRLLVPRESGL
jgi:diacylglycerol kinase family enzyme